MQLHTPTDKHAQAQTNRKSKQTNKHASNQANIQTHRQQKTKTYKTTGLHTNKQAHTIEIKYASKHYIDQSRK